MHAYLLYSKLLIRFHFNLPCFLQSLLLDERNLCTWTAVLDHPILRLSRVWPIGGIHKTETHHLVHLTQNLFIIQRGHLGNKGIVGWMLEH